MIFKCCRRIALSSSNRILACGFARVRGFVAKMNIFPLYLVITLILRIVILDMVCRSPNINGYPNSALSLEGKVGGSSGGKKFSFACWNTRIVVLYESIVFLRINLVIAIMAFRFLGFALLYLWRRFLAFWCLYLVAYQ